MNVDNTAPSRPKYRPDVDGLRAVAVLLVVAGHLRTRVAGGFIGVDVFFVISGYFISAVILSQMAQGRFSIADFYERRIRRIFPAMLAMMAVTTALVYRYFIPNETMSYARSLLAAVLSVSNLLFFHESGYFDAASASKPLLHTWSLAVEEQFYIVFPLLLLLVRRWFPTRLKFAIFALAGMSFAAALVVLPRSAEAGFFFAPLRAWELLIGTVVSQHYVRAPRGVWARNAASAGGLLLILVPAVLYTDATPFPGLAALPPCLGAALIIAGGEHGTTLVGRLLACRPVVFVGLISYSLYLWHWPIIVFQNTSSLLAPSVQSNSARVKLLVIAVSLAVGALSWRWIEQPFRQGRFRPGRRALFVGSGMAVAAILLLAAALLGTHGVPGRYPADAREVASYAGMDENIPFRGGSCFLGPDSSFADFKPAVCLPRQGGRRSILIVGDSHAAQLWQGMRSAFPQDSMEQATVSGCRPLVSLPAGTRSACVELLRFIFHDYLIHQPVDRVILAGRWTPGDLSALAETVRFLQAQRIAVTVVGPNIEYDLPLPRVLALALRSGTLPLLDSHRTRTPEQMDGTMAALASSTWHVPYVSIYKDLCRPECPVFAGPRVPLLFDDDHFTTAGSVLFANAVKAHGEL